MSLPRSAGSVAGACLFLMLVHSAALRAAEPASTSCRATGDRPSVGLVLSGGGARGAAHIGVLRVLERQRVPVDCIAGTSMGAIVGGLYASGVSPSDIERALEDTDWTGTIADAGRREDRSFRRKRDDDLLLVKAKPGFRDGELKIPTGFVQGQNVATRLNQMTLHVAETRDFDRLPTPFRAVATDIVTGEAVVLGTGRIAQALQASMAVPGAFAPVEIDGRMLVDGGVANNLPVDVARDMGADVVIAVDISTPLRGPDDIDSVFAVADQLTNILTRSNTEPRVQSLGPGDILIVPDLGDLYTTDFHRTGEAVPVGENAAEAIVSRLATLSVDGDRWSEWLVARQPRTHLPDVDFIRIQNDSRLSDRVLEDRLEFEAGAPLDPGAVDRSVSRIYGLESFQRVSWSLEANDDETGVLIDAESKTWGPDFLQFGAVLEDDFEGDSKYNFTVAYTRTEMNDLGGEWRAAATVGQDPAFFTEWYQPLDRNLRFFVNPAARYRKRNVNIFEGNDRIAAFRITEWGGELSAGRVLDDWGELRLGVRASRGDADVRIGDPEESNLRFDLGEVFAAFRLDELDNPNFPRRGGFLQVEVSSHRPGIGDDSSFDQVEASGLVALTRGRHTFVPALSVASTVGGQAPFYARFPLGGFLSLSGFETEQLSGEHAVLGSVTYYRRMGRVNIVPVYIGGSLEYGDTFENNIELDNLRAAGSLFLGVDSPLGPLYLAGGWAEGGNSSIYMFLGRPF